MSIQNISNLIYDVKEKLTDNEFKSIMDELKDMHNNNDDDVLCKEFFKQHFYHSHKNNKTFIFVFCNHDSSLRCMHEYTIKQVKLGDNILYAKSHNPYDDTYAETTGVVEKIMPKYSVINFDTYKKKVSNITLCKILYYPYVRLT